jgi:hypothetical protein
VTIGGAALFTDRSPIFLSTPSFSAGAHPTTSTAANA